MSRTFRNVLVLLALFIGAATVPGSPSVPETAPTPHEPLVSTADVKALAKGNNQFAIDLYKKLAEKDGNVFFSPYSISSVLRMTSAGARGKTAEEMAKVLGVGDLGDKGHPVQWELTRGLRSEDGKDNQEFHVANALWVQKDMALLPGFLDLTKRCYAGGFRELPFASDSESARKCINGWVGEQTRDKIPELLKPGTLKPSTVLVLTNAIYFKGDWILPFNAKRTRDGQFQRTPTDHVILPLMMQTAEFRYAEVGAARVLELPYVAGNFSMVLVLPKRAEDMGRVQTALTGGSFDDWLGKTVKQSVLVTLPKFQLRGSLDLIPPLKQLGMVSAFKDADFSGITKSRDLQITGIIHEAFLDVDEKGTVASAATAEITGILEKKVVEFRVDRPFLVAIRHRDTGSILFLGRVSDPATRQE